MDMCFYFLFLVGLRRWLKALAEARAAVVLGAVRSHKTTGVFRVVKGSEPSGCTVGKNFFFFQMQARLSPPVKMSAPKYILSHKPFLLVEHYQPLDLG